MLVQVKKARSGCPINKSPKKAVLFMKVWVQTRVK